MARILLIDDDELLRDTVCQMLEIDRHEVTQACDGRAGVALFRSRTFDMVITDVLMPVLDGAGVISAIRETDGKLPIIAISGGRRVLSPTFNLETAMLAGATLQLAKPFTRQQLQSAIAGASCTSPH